jgi:formate dehydrogenase iron-sulfur subunit
MAEKTDKGFLINQVKCTGCRGCQVACKAWNQNPAVATVNTGSHENPPKLSYQTFTRISFHEKEVGGQMEWRFVKEQCQHCTSAACVMACPTGALAYSPEGPVTHDIEKCIGCRYCLNACPFSVPQFNEATKKVAKCDLCHSRVVAGMTPACAKTCPTGAIQYGDLGKLEAAAKTEIAKAEKAGKQLSLYGADLLGGLRVLRLLDCPPEEVGLPSKPSIPRTMVAWKDFFKPLVKYGLPITVGAIFLHYLVKGPNAIHDEGGES